MAASTTDGATPAPKTMLVYSHSWLPGQVDGVAIRIMAHVRSLTERGSKVVVVTPDFVPVGEPGVPPKNDPIPGVEHVTLETSRMPVYRKNFCMRFSVRNLLTLISTIKRIQPDYVHATQEASLQVMALACAICDVPLVISLHTDTTAIVARDDGFGSWAFRRFNVYAANLGYRNWAFSGATYLPVSDHARHLLRTAGIPETNVAQNIWGPMVDRKLFRIDMPEDKIAEARKELTFGIQDAFLMIYAGRVTAEKDIDFLVDALDRNPKNVVLGLIGPGSLCDKLKRLHGKEKRLHCTGEFVSRETVALYMRAADCCVSASVMETVGFTAMEALSAGTPMLAANAQGFAEHLTHGTNARLFAPHDEASFDKELKELMATRREGCWAREALRESMSMASVDKCTERALAAYSMAHLRDQRLLRLIVTMYFFVFNWSLLIFVN